MSYSTSEIMKNIDDGKFRVQVNEHSFKQLIITEEGDIFEKPEEVMYWESYLYWATANPDYWRENF